MIYRKERVPGQFVSIDKEFIYDDRLSMKAKGIMTYILSRPDDWQFYITEIVTNAKDSKDAISTGIKELITCGYIERYRKRDEKGILREYVYIVHESPKTDYPELD